MLRPIPSSFAARAHVAVAAAQRLVQARALERLERQGDVVRHLRARGVEAAQAQIRRGHARALRERGRRLDRVLELAHVARPAVRDQPLERLRLEPDHLGAARRALQEVAGEHGHVLGSLAQRRQRERHHAQAIEEIRAEAAGGHLAGEVAVGRGDEPHVDRLGLGRAERANLALLDRAQQLRLQRQRQLADLVQEQGAAVGRAEQALGVADGAGERAAHVAEQLAFDHALGQRAAVDGHERPAAARRGLVDRARQQLLAGAALGLDQDVALVAREVAHGLQHPAHRARLRDHPLERLAAAELALELAVAHAQPPPLERALQRLQHPARVLERLLEIVERARAHAGDRRVDAGVAGHHHDLGVGPPLAQLAEELHARRAAQPQVEQHHLGLVRELRAHQHGIVRLQHRVAAALELAAQRAHEWPARRLRPARARRVLARMSFGASGGIAPRDRSASRARLSDRRASPTLRRT